MYVFKFIFFFLQFFTNRKFMLPVMFILAKHITVYLNCSNI